MSEKEQKKKLKPIEQCPDGHFYNSSRTGDICAVCGKKLDPQVEELTPDELSELVQVDEADWVCGFLVCYKGPNKGREYIIKDGKNLIGSASGMDIQIVCDKKIEKKGHAVIVYDSKQKRTILLPTDSHGMVYRKGQAVFEPVSLDAFDDIELGESVFKFVPFCGEDFSWENTGDEK